MKVCLREQGGMEGKDTVIDPTGVGYRNKEKEYVKKKQNSLIPSNIMYHNNIFINEAKFIEFTMNDNGTKIVELLPNYKIEWQAMIIIM